MSEQNSSVYLADINGERLDVFLSRATNESRSHIKHLIEKGAVCIEDERVFKAGTALKAGQRVLVEFPKVDSYDILPQKIDINIVFEDDYLAVVDKPQNMSVHPSGSIVSGTLVNALLYRLSSLSGINGQLRPGIVHRLDKDTSGLMLVAKNDLAHNSLAEQISSKTAVRTYTALCEGALREDSGEIQTLIGRDAKDRKKMAVVGGGGRLAKTSYIVLKRYLGYTLVSFTLSTGRTHQIRVHSKYIGHPIVGDLTYGIKKQRFNLIGQLLHSSYLEFTHPKTGERMSFNSSLPSYFEDVLKKIK